MKPKACLNCGARGKGKYCPDCGQEMNTNRFTAKEIVKDVSKNVFHWESSGLNTLKELFKHPGSFVKSYLAGKRIKFLRPIPFFFFVQTIYLIIFQWMHGGYYMFFNMTFTNETGLQKEDELMRLIASNINYFNFLLPLIFAFLLKLFIKKRTGFNYTEAVIFSLYVFGAVLIFGSVLMVISLIHIDLWDLRFFVVPAYIIYAVIGFAGYPKFTGTLKSILIILISYILFMALIALGTLTYVRLSMHEKL